MNITPDKVGKIRVFHSTYKARKVKAFGIVEKAFSLCSRPYVALSGGKDSVATLAIVDIVARKLDRDYAIWGHVSDASFPNTVEVIEQCAKISGRKLYLDKSPVSSFDVIRDSVTPFGKKGYFFDAIKRFVKEYNADLTFVGVRASESNRRNRAIKFRGDLFESNTAGHRLICYPVAWMDTEDIFAIAVEYGYPIHDIYYKNHPDGLDGIRLSYTTAKDLMHLGTSVFLRENYPEIYNKLIGISDEYSRYT